MIIDSRIYSSIGSEVPISHGMRDSELTFSCNSVFFELITCNMENLMGLEEEALIFLRAPKETG